MGLPFRKSTELAAQLIRELKAPGASNVMVLFDAYYLCHTVVQACREKRFCCASTLQGKRSLFKAGWKLGAGRYSKNLLRRRRLKFELRAASPEELSYAVQLPSKVRTDGISSAIMALDKDPGTAVNWEPEKKPKT